MHKKQVKFPRLNTGAHKQRASFTQAVMCNK